MSNAAFDRNRSRSPQPPHTRMPSPAFPNFHSESNATMGWSFPISMNSLYPPVATSSSYNSYVYPSTPPAVPPTEMVHVIHHSKHHSSSKNHHHKHSGHGHSHSHSHSHPHPQPHHLPPSSPSPMPSFPISPLFSMPSPEIHFPTLPHHQLFHSSSSNNLHKVPSPKPPMRQTDKHHAPNPLKLTKLPVEPLNPDFQHSTCSGRRRALCIGINYRGQENELRGCINDAKNVRNFLMRNNYRSSEITILTEDTNDPRMLPTRHNILGAMRWLVHGAKAHDSLFFHYSGHGGQTPDLDGDEADGFDEVIFPLDFKTEGHIVDDLMHDILVKPLPRGCRLTGLFDACHSGSVLDLQYLYSPHGRLKTSPITRRAIASKATAGDVISWSACQDGQNSADTFAGGVAVGAMSHAFITALTNQPDQTYQELFRSIRLILNPRYSQKPQLGSSHQLDTNRRFIF